ncbi:hypothetical protein [Streptomyces sp. NPDC059979]|uniref:hypothetical protein n=1 Tax=Streptomyces sp. NPDC059979 TaxID=3347021 RepID=UPI0036C65714
MEVRETGNASFGEVEHPLLRQQVLDPKTGREGVLMAVCETTRGYTQGRHETALTAYIRDTTGREFTAAAGSVVAA